MERSALAKIEGIENFFGKQSIGYLATSSKGQGLEGKSQNPWGAIDGQEKLNIGQRQINQQQIRIASEEREIDKSLNSKISRQRRIRQNSIRKNI